MTTVPAMPSLPATRNDQLEAVYSKVFLRIVPFLMALWVIAWIDRVNVGFAKLQMIKDLGFSEAVYGLGAGIFFLGYFIFETPSNLLMVRIGARKTIARITLGWGLTSMTMIFVKTPLTFYLLRFLLGVFEAGFYPGVILYLTYWFPTTRRARAFGFFMSASALAGVIGGPLAGTIMSEMTGVHGLRGWQWIFLIEGIPSMIAGVVTLLYLTDAPSKARWLSAGEIAALEADLARDGANLGGREHSVLASLRTPAIWQFIAIFFLIILANSALTFWGPSIVADAGFSDPIAIGWIMAAVYLVGASGMILNGMSSDRAGEARLHCGVAAAIGGMALVGLGFFGAVGPWVALVSLAIAVTGTMSAIPVFWQMPSAAFSGAAAAAAIAVINSFANLAGLGSPWFIGAVKDATGQTGLGFVAVGAAEIFALALILLFVRERRIVSTPIIAH